MNALSNKNIYFVGLISLILGILFNYLFYDKQIGISFLIYIVLLLAGLFGFLFFFKITYNKTIIWFLPPILFFASMSAVRANEFLLFFNFVMVTALLLLLSHQAIGRNIRKALFLDYFKTAMLLPLNMLGRSLNALGRIVSIGKIVKMNERTSQITKGILITLPIVLFVLFLLSSADLVFKKILTEMFNFNFSINPDVVAQIWWAAAFGMLWLGVYIYILENISNNENSPSSPEIRSFRFGNIEAGILFTALNILFLTFVMIQLKYLFAGNAAITELGFTYAEYAHRGFGELIGVALLTFGLVFLAERYIERNGNKPSVLFKALAGILMMLVLIIMSSAFLRLKIYEEAYGFTLLRILAQAFIIWLAAVFLWLSYKIFKNLEDRPFVFGIFLSVVSFFVFFNLLNPDSFVTKKNIDQFAKTGKLDAKYLSELSADAVPNLITLLDEEAVSGNGEQISKEVAVKLKSYHDSLTKQPWQSYNFSRTRALNLINSKWSLISTLLKE